MFEIFYTTFIGSQYHIDSLIRSVVDCEWDEWNIGRCSKTCGGGMVTNTRVPKVDVQHGGEECTGSSTVTESCNVHECPGNLLIICKRKS